MMAKVCEEFSIFPFLKIGEIVEEIVEEIVVDCLDRYESGSHDN